MIYPIFILLNIISLGSVQPREIEHEMTFEPEVEIDGAPSAWETQRFHHEGPEVCWLNLHSMNALVDSDSNF